MIKHLYLLFCIVLFSTFILKGQDNNISVSSESKPLSAVLEDISDKYSIKFAFDSDKFKKINVTYKLKKIPFSQFLIMLEKDYQIRSRNIEGTWVLVFDRPEQSENVLANHLIQTPEIPVKEAKYTMVTGFVKDKNSGENLMYCNVGFGDFKGVITNELGFFSIKLPGSDKVKVSISHLGYNRLDTLISGGPASVIYLVPLEYLMDAVQVTNEEKEILEVTQQPGKIAFNPLKTSNAPRLANDDMANSLLLIPGIDFLQGGNAGISIRGAYPADNLILFDGIPVLEATHLLGNMSVLNSKFIQQAFVSRGGFDAGFGGKVGGLIELTGKSGKNMQPFLDISANMLNFNALASLPISEKFSVTAAWRRSFIDKWQNYLYTRLIDNVSTLNQQNDLVSGINPTIEFQDINSKISFHPSDKLEFNLNFLFGSDYQSRDFKLVNTGEYYRNELINSENMGTSFNWKWQINKNWYHSFSAGFSKLSKDQVDETGKLVEYTEVVSSPGASKGKGKGLLKTREKTYTKMVYDTDNGTNDIDEYRIDWKTEIKTGIIQNQAGAGWSANTFNYDYLANRGSASIPVDSVDDGRMQYLVNAFVQQKIAGGQIFNFRWGLRSDFDLISRKVYWQPRGGIEFKPDPHITFHYSGGVYTQFLSSIKRIDSEGHYNPVWYLPDYEGIGAVNSIHHIFGIKFEKDGWLINAEGFSRNTSGKINLFAEKVATVNQNIIQYFSEKSNEFGKGIDIMIEKRQGILNHIVGYSLSNSEEQMVGYFNNKRFPTANDRLHRFKINEMLSIKNWTISGIWNFSTGLPVINLTDINPVGNIIRTSNFSQLDFSVAKRLSTNHFNLNAGVSLLNVLDRKNIVEVDYLRFSSETGSLSVRSDVSTLSFTPVFFISLKFY